MMKVVEKMLEWKNAGRLKLLSVGYSLRSPELLFRKIEDEEVKAQVKKLQEASKEKVEEETNKPGSADQKSEIKRSEITFDDFSKVDLRVGTIISAQKVEKG
jgi:methionyl-tRNA synthetase